jgi:predicted transposase/invertase (TIGR01784 family)
VLDVRVNTASGKDIDVEIQLASVPGMRERIQFYNASLASQQAKAGMRYQDLKQAISVIITDFILIDEDDDYLNCFRMCNLEKKVGFSDFQVIYTLELPKLPPEWDGTRLWLWLRFFASKTEGEFMAVAQRDPVVAQAWGRLKELSADENTRLLVEYREKVLMDERSRIHGARSEGLLEGFEKGIEKGIEKGHQEGLQEGIWKGVQEGRQENAYAVARNALRRNMPIELIADLTGLTPEKIQKLAKS